MLFGCKFYFQFYSDENKELNLNNVTDISYLSGDGVEINTLDGEKIQVNSYFDIVRYSISHPDSKYDTKVRKTVVTKSNKEKHRKNNSKRQRIQWKVKVLFLTRPN